jgi:peptidoglycan hydrolase-like protein with peptidoglycan-binding domain
MNATTEPERPVLYFGKRGNQVKVVQRALNLKNYYVKGNPLVVDGFFGPQMKASVKQFQNDHGLSKTGDLTYEEIEMLLDSLEIHLGSCKPREPKFVLPSNSTFGTNLQQQSVRNLALAFLILLIFCSTVFIVNNGYAAEIWIKDVTKIMLFPNKN